MRALILAVAAAAIVAAGPAALAAGPRLAPNEIQAQFFNGTPFTASTTSNVKFKMTFKPDGTVTREPNSKVGGAKGEGTWKLSKDGFCTTWKGSKANCYNLVTSGDNKWSVMKGSTVMATWSK
jgi:hypothetical protein